MIIIIYNCLNNAGSVNLIIIELGQFIEEKKTDKN